METDNVDVEGTQDTTACKTDSKDYPKYSRNFLVFNDSSGFPGSYFPTTRPKIPKRKYCPITGLPAKYFDPVTQSPYSTAEAFKLIRSRYADTEQQKCEQRLLQLSSWLSEKKKMVETKWLLLAALGVWGGCAIVCCDDAIMLALLFHSIIKWAVISKLARLLLCAVYCWRLGPVI